MPTDRTPRPAQVYSVRGRPALYVRTEQRPGSAKPQHLFVQTHDRVVVSTWLDELPDDFELIIDTDGRAEANDLKWQLWAAEHERQIMVDLLKQACDWLPPAKARELRQRYVDTRPERVQ